MELGTTPASEKASGSGCRGALGKLVPSVFFGLFLGLGLLFVGLMVAAVARDVVSWTWAETPCIIESSRIEETGDDDHPYRLSVSYRYVFRGREHTSTMLGFNDTGTDDYSRAQRDLGGYRPGSGAVCYVNPRRPEDAVLVRRVPWYSFMIVLPLVFVAIGGGGLYFTWRKASGSKGSPQPLSKKARTGKAGRLVGQGLGAIFMLIGGALFVWIGVIPAYRTVRAEHWAETECTVVSSAVRSHSSDDGTTYSIDILYEYELAGRTWRSNRYDFVSWSSSGYDSKRSVVDRYPAGSPCVCYVDPSDPASAVLSRGFRPAHLVGLFPLLFLGAGAAVFFGLRARRARASKPAGAVVRQVEGANTTLPTGAVVLKPRYGPVLKLVLTVLFAAFWNGIVSVFVVIAVKSWLSGDPEWFLTIFLIPFVLVGLGALGMIGHAFLALFNPRPVLTLSPGVVRLGASVQLDWRFGGRASRIRHLTITLEGREEATYRRGTDTQTDTEVFARLPLVDETHPSAIAQGSAQGGIPEDTMHSFSGESNKIVWSLRVTGDIARWPDVSAEYVIEVQPLAREELLP
jgi:hypothetical protein